ncbi:MAG: NapC/NirT family cytochrome c [Acidobacteriia bacterium]|nr:NapC/NirT family cytochrome c [Terriglobia bacterium]
MSPEDSKPHSSRHVVRNLLRMMLRNAVSLAGVALALVSLANFFFLFLIDLISERPSPYVDILAYMVAPACLICGLVLIAIGLWWERRKKIEEVAEFPRYPRIDLNDPNQRSAVAFFASFLGAFVMLSAVGSYKAYEFTDSVQFCGQLCHSVMNPEFTAYQLSPHARVACVECHVGSGATWYVKSKLSGARQVYATLFKTYPRPIPTPVHDLRPAPDTCEECHWPQRFYGAQLKVFTHYANDEKNTPLQVRMLLKTGGGDPSTGAPSGIHWHMNISNEITYIASDDRRQTIPYIHVKDMQGRITEYMSKDAPPTKEQIEKLPRRRMDCVDCHNRPTHIYVPPDRAVDESLQAGRLDVTLPYIKQQAVTVLAKTYSTTEAAMEGIATDLHEFYTTKYPEIDKSRQEDIRHTIGEVQRIYRSATFPEMKLDWKTHPNNIGHFYYTGCFRCHDGQHVSSDGRMIRKDCDICHTVLGQQEGATRIISAEGSAFKHPVDIGDLTQVSCSDCHTGGVGP